MNFDLPAGACLHRCTAVSQASPLRLDPLFQGLAELVRGLIELQGLGFRCVGLGFGAGRSGSKTLRIKPKQEPSFRVVSPVF